MSRGHLRPWEEKDQERGHEEDDTILPVLPGFPGRSAGGEVEQDGIGDGWSRLTPAPPPPPRGPSSPFSNPSTLADSSSPRWSTLSSSVYTAQAAFVPLSPALCRRKTERIRRKLKTGSNVSSLGASSGDGVSNVENNPSRSLSSIVPMDRIPPQTIPIPVHYLVKTPGTAGDLDEMGLGIFPPNSSWSAARRDVARDVSRQLSSKVHNRAMKPYRLRTHPHQQNILSDSTRKSNTKAPHTSRAPLNSPRFPVSRTSSTPDTFSPRIDRHRLVEQERLLRMSWRESREWYGFLIGSRYNSPRVLDTQAHHVTDPRCIRVSSPRCTSPISTQEVSIVHPIERDRDPFDLPYSLSSPRAWMHKKENEEKRKVLEREIAEFNDRLVNPRDGLPTGEALLQRLPQLMVGKSKFGSQSNYVYPKNSRKSISDDFEYPLSMEEYAANSFSNALFRATSDPRAVVSESSMLRPPSENRTRGGIELEQIIPHGSVEVSLKPPAKPSPISSPRVSARSPRRREPLSESRSPRSLNRETGTRSKRVALSTDSLGARDDLQGSQSPRNSSPRGFSIHDATLWTRTVAGGPYVVDHNAPVKQVLFDEAQREITAHLPFDPSQTTIQRGALRSRSHSAHD